MCITGASGEEVTGTVAVEVPGRGRGVSELNFAYQVPESCTLSHPQLPIGHLHRAILSVLDSPTFLFFPSLTFTCLFVLLPTGPQGVFHFSRARPQSWGNLPHCEWFQAPDRTPGGPSCGSWRPALSPVRADSLSYESLWASGREWRGQDKVHICQAVVET